MKIAHIYIQEFKILKNINIPINSEHNCNFNNGNLEIRRAFRDFVAMSYYDDVSISAVIGENGVGKSTLLEFIEASFGYLNGSGFIVWHDPLMGYSIHVYNMKLSSVVNTSDSPHDINYLYDTVQLKKKVKLIKINNLPNTKDSIKKNNSKYVKYLPLSNLQVNNKDRFLRTYNYVLHNPRGDKFKGSQASFEFTFNYHNLDDTFLLMEKFTPDWNNLKKHVSEKLSLIKNYSYELEFTHYGIIDQLLDLTSLSTLKSLVLNSRHSKPESNVIFANVVSSYLRFRTNGAKNASKSFKQCLTELTSYVLSARDFERYTLGFSSYAFFLDSILSNADKEKLTLEDNKFVLTVENAEQAYRGVKELDAVPGIIKHNIGYGWKGFSSGEFALIRFFCELESIVIKLKRNTDSFVFVIDEADLYLHPEWQREFIDELIDYMCLLGVSKKSQIILTTHSPIIISDFLPNDIISLTKNSLGCITIGSSRGFGTPISELYIEGMHLTSTFGSRSKRHIDNIIKNREELTSFQKGLIEKIKSRNIRKMLGENK